MNRSWHSTSAEREPIEISSSRRFCSDSYSSILAFASFFALYSGLVFLLAAGLMLSPVFHRVLHRFHWEEK